MATASNSVRIVLTNRHQPDQFLILCETDDPSNWKLPGGKFEPDETPTQAASRELIEELGLTTHLNPNVELINDDGISRRFIFTATIDPAQVQPSHEISQTAWVTIDTVPAGTNRHHILAAVSGR